MHKKIKISFIAQTAALHPNRIIESPMLYDSLYYCMERRFRLMPTTRQVTEAALIQQR